MPEPHVFNRPNIKTVPLECPVPFLVSGRGPVVVAVPAVASGLIGEAVVRELKERAATEARQELVKGEHDTGR